MQNLIVLPIYLEDFRNFLDILYPHWAICYTSKYPFCLISFETIQLMAFPNALRSVTAVIRILWCCHPERNPWRIKRPVHWMDGLGVLRLHRVREKIALRQKLVSRLSREVTRQAITADVDIGYILWIFFCKTISLDLRKYIIPVELFCHTTIPYQLYSTLEHSFFFESYNGLAAFNM
jgi:hypothetical protein